MVQRHSIKDYSWVLGVLAFVLLVSIATLEYLLPTFRILKLATEVGGLLAVIGFFAQLLGNALNKANQQQQALENRLKAEIKEVEQAHNDKLRDLQEIFAKIEQRLEIHINSYGHKSITTDLQELSKQVVAVRTELALSRDLTDAFDRLDKIEKQLSLNSQ